jgi:hypothetical protein
LGTAHPECKSRAEIALAVFAQRRANEVWRSSKSVLEEEETMKTVIAFLLFSGLQLAAQDMQSCPMHREHMKEASQHQAEVEKHGDEAMGFPHDKTTHHFRLYSDLGLSK